MHRLNNFPTLSLVRKRRWGLGGEMEFQRMKNRTETEVNENKFWEVIRIPLRSIAKRGLFSREIYGAPSTSVGDYLALQSISQGRLSSLLPKKLKFQQPLLPLTPKPPMWMSQVTWPTLLVSRLSIVLKKWHQARWRFPSSATSLVCYPDFWKVSGLYILGKMAFYSFSPVTFCAHLKPLCCNCDECVNHHNTEGSLYITEIRNITHTRCLQLLFTTSFI